MNRQHETSVTIMYHVRSPTTRPGCFPGFFMSEESEDRHNGDS